LIHIADFQIIAVLNTAVSLEIAVNLKIIAGLGINAILDRIVVFLLNVILVSGAISEIVASLKNIAFVSLDISKISFLAIGSRKSIFPSISSIWLMEIFLLDVGLTPELFMIGVMKYPIDTKIQTWNRRI